MSASSDRLAEEGTSLFTMVACWLIDVTDG